MNNILYRLHQVSKGQKIQPAFILESKDYKEVTSELERLQALDEKLQSKYIDYCNSNNQRVSNSLLFCYQRHFTIETVRINNNGCSETI